MGDDFVCDIDAILQDSPPKKKMKLALTQRSSQDSNTQNGSISDTGSDCSQLNQPFDVNIIDISSDESDWQDDRAKKKDEELALTIDELLTLPEKPEDDGKSMDELLDDLDVQIAEQKEKHRLQIEKLDEDAKIQQRRKEDREARYAANAINRNRLATELTQPVLKKMFANIRGFLEEIKAGLCKSTRHQAYHKSLRTRQALLYTQITHPFTDQQVDWAYKEFADIWLRTKQEHADNNDYVWKVLMPEGFIRLYSDFFQVTMKEAEQMIKETPFDDSDDESSDSSSENDN